MASAAGILAPMAQRLLRVAVTKTMKMVRTKIASATRPLQGELQSIPIRTTNRQPIHPSALLRQQKNRSGGRWFSTSQGQSVNSAFRRFFSNSGGNGGYTGGSRFNRADFPSSKTSRRVAQLSGRAPFASTLRPNLTGGAFPRTQGGYSLGGNGARYFSHTPAAPAQVVQNVTMAMRAFSLSGQKARFDGLGPRGEKRYRAVSALEHEAFAKMSAAPRAAPGSFVDFHLSPTVTALSPLMAAFPYRSAVPGIKPETVAAATLCADGLLDALSVDFARALKDLSAIFSDLKKLSGLGDLPVMLEKTNILRVRFPGVDADTVERLCDDLTIQRGIVGQDPDFEVANGVPIALRFPFAPDAAAEKTLTSPGGSMRSLSGHDLDEAFMDEMDENPWLSDPEGYESLSPPVGSGEHGSEDFEGLEGIYRFLAECDRAKGRF
jgi:hypothetical protein